LPAFVHIKISSFLPQPFPHYQIFVHFSALTHALCNASGGFLANHLLRWRSAAPKPSSNCISREDAFSQDLRGASSDGVAIVKPLNLPRIFARLFFL
jgi:hypothetical protein